MNNSSSQTFSDDLDIRQAQHKWRLAKRREMEAKARKKQFKRTSIASQAQQPHPPLPHPSHTQPPHVHASALYATAAMPTVTHSLSQLHPVHIQPGLVLSHSDAVVSAQMALQSQPPVTAAHHAHQMHHTAIAPAPTMDPSAAATAAALQLHQHLNANAKRTHMALEEDHGPDDPDAVAAARAAAVHAAASAAPGDALFAQNVTAGVPPPTSSASMPNAPRVEELGTEADHLASNEANRRVMEQLEAQRQWREAKRREIAAKKAKGAASKRGRKKARTTTHANFGAGAPDMLHPTTSQPSSQLPMASMHMAVSAGYVRDVSAQAVVSNVQPAQMTEEHQTALYDGVHGPQNVEQMLQQSVDDAGNVPQNTRAEMVSVSPHTSKATLVANPNFHRYAANATVLAPSFRRTGAFAPRVATPKDETGVVTTELLAASTEAALNAVPDPKGKSFSEPGKEETTGIGGQKSGEEPSAQRDVDVKEEAGVRPDDASCVTLVGTGSGTTVPHELVSGPDIDPKPPSDAHETPSRFGSRSRISAGSGASIGGVEGVHNLKEAEDEVGKSTTAEDGDTKSREDVAAQTTAEVVAQATAEAVGETEGERESRDGGEEVEEPVSGTQQDGTLNTEKHMVNLHHDHQDSADENEMQVPRHHEGELKDDTQDGDGLEVDGGEDIMTAAAWQSLDSISHT